jgi:hypothetical protein
VAPRTKSHDALLLEVPPEAQREIAERVDHEVSLRLRLAEAGTFKSGARYKVLESDGFSVTLSEEVQEDDGTLRIVGRVSRPSA